MRPAFDLAVTATLTPLLTDASGSATSLKPVSATMHTLAVPWTLLLVVLALIAAVVLFRWGRARRKTREDARVKEAVEQALAGQAPARD